MTQTCLLRSWYGSLKQTPNENVNKINKMPLSPETASSPKYKIRYDQIVSSYIMHHVEWNVNKCDRKTQQVIAESL